jgi:hypothetical protein
LLLPAACAFFSFYSFPLQADGGELAAAICAASAALADAAIEQTDILPACSVVSFKAIIEPRIDHLLSYSPEHNVTHNQQLCNGQQEVDVPWCVPQPACCSVSSPPSALQNDVSSLSKT